MRRVLLALLCTIPASVLADTVAQNLPFTQDWSNADLITVNDDWSGVPGIIGYRGDGISNMTGTNPQGLLIEGTNVVDVNINQANPNTFTTGGVSEFAITDPVVALQGSGTADAPHLVITVSTTAQTAIRVRYNLRDIDGAADNAIQPVALQYRIGTTGDFIDLPAGFVADASTGPSLATLVTPVDVTLPVAAENQPVVQLRVITSDAVGSDEWIGIDDINITGTGSGSDPFINVGNLMMAEGTGTTTTFNVPVTLSAPAGKPGVSFTASTTDGTAVAPGDYAALSAVPFTIPGGMSSINVPVTVTADSMPEAGETFTLTIAGITGAVGQNVTGTVTINNDDIPVVEIFELQGSGVTSPFVGQIATLNANVVTALAPNGFFIQTPTARDDNNPNTSNGVFVFTSTAPTVAVGNQVNVTGTVEEFFNSTQISGSPTVQVVSSGNPLPAPLAFDASRPSGNPNAPSCSVTASPDVETSNFECFEGMLVSIANGTVGDGNQRFATDLVAEARITAGPRAFREIGAAFPGLGGTIPVWDGNPQVFEIDVNKLSAAFGNPLLSGGSTFSATGVLGYEFNDYELWPTAFNLLTTNVLPVAVAVPETGALTIGSINLQRFCNDLNDPGPVGNCTPVLSTAEFTRRLVKTSAYIRTQLRAPAIVAVVEMENLATLQSLANQISTDDPSLIYMPFLAEGNDVGGIDNGFLVRVGASFVTSPVATQLDLNLTGNATTCSGGAGTCRVHDRPPYLLTGTWGPTGQPFAVMVNHTRSFLDIESPTEGPRIRSKRLEQAQAIAQQVQNFQVANASTPLVLVGDYNAFEFTDGYVDVINQIRGTAVPAQNLLSGPNITNPTLVNALGTLAPAQQYSYTFGGSAQTIDHVLLTTAGQREFIGYSFARGNADAAVDLFNAPLATSPLRISDHEGLVVRLRMLGADVAPMVGYVPMPNNAVLFTGQGLIGSTANGSIAVTGSGGSGVPGPLTTTTVNNCVISSVSPGGSFAGFTQSLSFVAGTLPQTGTLSGTCVAQATASNAILTCQETRGGGTPTPRNWPLSCPAANATPLLIATPPANAAVDFGQVVLGERLQRSIALSNPGTATTTLSNCTVTGAGFTLNSASSITIAAGGTSSINVMWRALFLGANTGSLSCNTNVAGLPTITWPLTGAGVPGVLTAIPATDAFGRLLLLLGLAGFGLFAVRRRIG